MKKYLNLMSCKTKLKCIGVDRMWSSKENVWK